MQAALREAHLEPQECNAWEVLQKVARSVQDTCHSVGVVLDLPWQPAGSSKGLMPAAQSTEAPIAGSTAAPSSRITQRRSVQWADSKADSSRSAGASAPALLPPPSRAALGHQRRPATAGLRACVNSEVCSCASSNLCIHALLCKTASIL